MVGGNGKPVFCCLAERKKRFSDRDELENATGGLQASVGVEYSGKWKVAKREFHCACAKRIKLARVLAAERQRYQIQAVRSVEPIYFPAYPYK
ncbi:hypothetical protein ACLOJK_012289 [Asimina triloba]